MPTDIINLPQSYRERIARQNQIGENAFSSLSNYAKEQNQKKQQEMQFEQENSIAAQMGMDLSGIRDPKTRQQAFEQAFKSQFSPEKQETALQQSQRMLNEEKLRSSQSNQNLFNRLRGDQQDETGRTAAMSSAGQQQIGQSPLETADEGLLEQISAFAGQPGEQGVFGNMAKSELQRREKKKEFKFKEYKESPEHKRDVHLESAQAQADVKYNENLQETSKQHELKEQTLERLEQLNKKGVTGKPYEKLLEKMGLVNLTSEGRREFAADVKNLITDIRSILGGQFSNFEFQTILNAYPSADFSKEANSSIIKNLKAFQDIKKKEVQFANQLKKDNKGKIPFDFQGRVNEMVHEYAQSKIPEIKENARKIMNEEYGIPEGNVLMFDPEGEPLNVSSQDVDRYLEFGAVLP